MKERWALAESAVGEIESLLGTTMRKSMAAQLRLALQLHFPYFPPTVHVVVVVRVGPHCVDSIPSRVDQDRSRHRQ